jgi:hypothetical protein
MIILESPRLEVRGNFAFVDGKLVKEILHYSISDVWGNYIAEAKGISRPAYSITTIKYNSRNFDIFVIPYKEIGPYYTKTIPHRANYAEYYQVLWGNPLFEVWQENETDGTVSVRKGAKRPLSTIAVNGKEHITMFNQGHETAVVLGYTSGNREDSGAREPLMLGPNTIDIGPAALMKKQENLKNESLSLLALLQKACRNILQEKG